MPGNWTDFKVFKEEPMLNYAEPLTTAEELDKYFVELDNPAIKVQVFNVKTSVEGLRSLFGKRILILGDNKVGKTSLKNYICRILEKQFNVARISINAGDIQTMRGVEKATIHLFRKWYYELCDRMKKEKIALPDQDVIFKRIIALYEEMFSQNTYDYSIVVFDQANILKKQEDAELFKTFCENFQGTWEDIPRAIKSRILILCLGNLDWANIFQLGERRSFGVFPDWIEYGNEWTIGTLRDVLERRIRHGLKEEKKNLVRSIVTDKLVRKLENAAGKNLSLWLRKFDEYLAKFGQEYRMYGENFENFDKFLDEELFNQGDFDQLIVNNKVIGVFEDLKTLRATLSPTKFDELVQFMDYLMKVMTVTKGGLKGLFKKDYPNLDAEFVIDELTRGSKEESPGKYQNAPFTTTKDNQTIILWPNLRKFFEKIQERTKITPSKFLPEYLGSKVSRPKEHVRDSWFNQLKDAQEYLAEIYRLAENRHNKSLIEKVQHLETELQNVIETWNSTDKDMEIKQKNIAFVKIKSNIANIVQQLILVPSELFGLPLEDPETVFNQFLQRTQTPGEQFDWFFHKTMELGNPDGTKDYILTFGNFVRKLKEVITQFDQDNTNTEKNRIIQDIGADLRRGIFWAVDVPNLHYLDIEEAIDYLNSAFPDSKAKELWAFLPEQYLQETDKYHSIYQNFSKWGFKPQVQPRKNKKEDIDGNFVNAVIKEVRKGNYRIIVLSMADQLVLNVIQEIQDTCPGVEIFVFLADIFDFAWNKFCAVLGEDYCKKFIRYFNIYHTKENTKFNGTVVLRQNYREMFRQGKAIPISYAENGIQKLFFISKQSYDYWPEIPIDKRDQYFIIKFVRERGTDVSVLNLTPKER